MVDKAPIPEEISDPYFYPFRGEKTPFLGHFRGIFLGAEKEGILGAWGYAGSIDKKSVYDSGRIKDDYERVMAWTSLRKLYPVVIVGAIFIGILVNIMIRIIETQGVTADALFFGGCSVAIFICLVMYYRIEIYQIPEPVKLW